MVTGASSGIGAATVRALARIGFDTVAAARRLERCEALAREVGGRAVELDVTNSASVAALAEAVPKASVVVHSAGGAVGLGPVSDADETQWRQMYETNVLGVMRVTKALLPALERSGGGHIVVIGSVAGVEVYPGGADTPPPSMPRTRCRGRCVWSCSASRSESPRLRRDWSRPSSPWCVSAATPGERGRCIAGSSH